MPPSTSSQRDRANHPAKPSARRPSESGGDAAAGKSPERAGAPQPEASAKAGGAARTTTPGDARKRKATARSSADDLGAGARESPHRRRSPDADRPTRHTTDTGPTDQTGRVDRAGTRPAAASATPAKPKKRRKPRSGPTPPRRLNRFPTGPARRRAHRRISRLRTTYLLAYLAVVAAPTLHSMAVIARTDPPWAYLAMAGGLGACAAGALAFWVFTGAARMRLDTDLALDGTLLLAAYDGDRRPAAVDLHGPDITVKSKRLRAGTRWTLHVRGPGGRPRITVALADPRVRQVRCAGDLRALADVLAASPEPEGPAAADDLHSLIPQATPAPDEYHAVEDCVPYAVPRGPADRIATAFWALTFLAAAAAVATVADHSYRYVHDTQTAGGVVAPVAADALGILVFTALALTGIGLYRLAVTPFRRGIGAYTGGPAARPDEPSRAPSPDAHSPAPPRPAEAGPGSLAFAAYPPRRYGGAVHRHAVRLAGPAAGLLALTGPVLASLALLRGALAADLPGWYWPAVSALAFGVPALLYWMHGTLVRHHHALNSTRIWLDGHRIVLEGPRGPQVGDLHSRRVRLRTVRGSAILYVPVAGWWHRHPVPLTQGRLDTWRPVEDLHRLAAALRSSPQPAGRVCASQILTLAPLAPGERLPRIGSPARPRVRTVVPAMPETVAGRGLRAAALLCTAVFVVLVGLTAASEAGGFPYSRTDGTVNVLVVGCEPGPPIGLHGFGRLPECDVVLPDGSLRHVPGGEFTPADVNTRVEALYVEEPDSVRGLLTAPGPVLARADAHREWSALPALVFAMCGAALLFVQACRLVFRRPPAAPRPG